jgi:hypothetical protein
VSNPAVRLHGASSNYVPVDWIEALEKELNANESVAEAWRKVANSVVEEGDLISFLYQDSQVKANRNKPMKELRLSLEKSALLLETLSAYVPELTSPEFMDLPHVLSDLAARLVIDRSHEDNECVMFYDSIISILVEPKTMSRGSFTGLPTYHDCIEIIQAAINATDKGQDQTRETRLTPDSLKAFLKRKKPELDLYRFNF